MNKQDLSPPPTPHRRAAGGEGGGTRKVLRRIHPRSESPPPSRLYPPPRSSSADDIIPLLRDGKDKLALVNRSQLSRSSHHKRGKAAHQSSSSRHLNSSSHHPNSPSHHLRRHVKGILHYTVLSATFVFRATSILGALMFCLQYIVLLSGVNVEMKAMVHMDWNTLGVMEDRPAALQQQRLRESSIINMTTRQRTRKIVMNVTLPAWVVCADGRNVSSCHSCAATENDPALPRNQSGGCASENFCRWCPYGAALDSTMLPDDGNPPSQKQSRRTDRSVTVYDSEGRITKVHDAHVPLGEQCVSVRQTCKPSLPSGQRLFQRDMELLKTPVFAEMVQKAAPHVVPKQCTSRGFQFCPYGALHSYHEALMASGGINNTDTSVGGTLIHRPPQCIPRRMHCQPPDDLLVQPNDRLYRGRYGSAVVVPSHRFIFVPIPKVACTVWYKLFRRMTGSEDWQSELGPLPQNPDINGLTYLADYSRAQATDMWTSPLWTKAVMVRNPKERLLSAYLDKIKHSHTRALVHGACCPDTNDCAKDHNMTLLQFVDLLVERDCWNTGDHWNLQSERMERKYWPHMTIIMHLKDAAEDSRRLLEKVGAWDEFGASGWGSDGMASIFSPSAATRHATNASQLVHFYYDTPALSKKVESLFAKDYKQKHFGFKIDRPANSPSEMSKFEKEGQVRDSHTKQEQRAAKTETGAKKKKI